MPYRLIIYFLVMIWAHGVSAGATTSTISKGTTPERISIDFNDIRRVALPRIQAEKQELKNTAVSINRIATDELRNTLDYAAVYEQFMRNLRALQSHNCYKDETTVEIPELKPPTEQALTALAAEQERLRKEQEEREHREQMVELQKQQQEKQDTIIKQQQAQLYVQAAQLDRAEEQVRQTRVLQIQNQQLNRQLRALNSQAAERNSLIYQQNTELEKTNRILKYGY